MAAPSQVTIWNLSGKWAVHASLSDDVQASLKLQGINWALRKAIVRANPVTRASMYTSPQEEEKTPTTHIVIVVPTPVVDIVDQRVLNWQPINHNDFVFGTVNTRTAWIGGLVDGEGRVRPNIQENIGDGRAAMFLRGEILADGSKCDGFLGEEGDGKEEPSWIYTLDQHGGGYWMDNMVWGFELIEGERYHTRRVVTMNSKSGQYELARVVLCAVEG